MGGGEDTGLQHRRGSVPMDTSPLSEKIEGAMPMFRTASEADPSYSSGWDPLISFTQSSNLGAASTVASGFVNSSYSWTLENHGIDSSSQRVQYPSDLSLAELVPMLPCFGDGNFTEMVGPFGLPECVEVPNNTANTLSNSTKTLKNCQTSEERIAGRPAGAKIRRREFDSRSPVKGPFVETSEVEVEEPRNDLGQKAELDEAKNRTIGGSKDMCLDEGGAKENYVHMRAKRGQATNSHSLAERVRREKISERMKILEELVPGCNKITGKALMLDEIINYVQSLQQQVEFLSMKLAAVNPDWNINTENAPHSRGSNATVPGFSSGVNPSNHFPHPIPQGFFAGIIPTVPGFQVGWENEVGDGFNLANFNMGTHGRPGLEF